MKRQMKEQKTKRSAKIITAVFITVHRLEDQTTSRDSWQRSRLLRAGYCNAWKLEPME